MNKPAILIFFIFLFKVTAFGQIVYVNANVVGGANNGSSWANAYSSLHEAISNTFGGQIWVAAGTYKPSQEYEGSGERFKAFRLKNNVAVYGGFTGTESALNDRDYAANQTILSGDIDNTPADKSLNCYHVINNSWIGSSAVLDGFIITGGNANGDYPNFDGGGMLNNNASPAINNCTFTGNSTLFSGAGICNNQSSPYINNCMFTNNTAGYSGGAIASQLSSSPNIERCTFINNHSDLHAGAILNYYSQAAISKCMFIGNSAVSNGGAIQNYGKLDGVSPTITNCAFISNSAQYGGGIYNCENNSPLINNCTFTSNYVTENGGAICSYSNSIPVVKNSILWGNYRSGTPNTISENYGDDNSNITYCCIREGSGTYNSTNIFSYPLFVDADGADNISGTSDDDLRLMDRSTCIGAGTAAGAPADDIGSISRGTPPDIGAFENALNSYVTLKFYVSTGGNNSDGTNWTNAYTSLQSALNEALKGDVIWVAKGTYKPTTDNNRTISFQIKDRMAVYGGFAGNESLIEQRVNFAPGQINETILSGDIGTPGVESDNSYHVINNNGLSSSTIINGFTITGGYADGTDLHTSGGGMLNIDSSPEIALCTFRKNSAVNGGAIYNNNSSPSFTNCVLTGNNASTSGGSVYNNNASPAFVSCTFTGNNAASGGGAVYNSSSSPTAVNSIFWGDYQTGNPSIVSEITGGTASNFTYCCIQEGSGTYTGTGNIFTKPVFVDADGADNIFGTSDDNLRIGGRSLCIGAGTNTGTPATDILGSTRGTPQDIGAYENELNSSEKIIYVNDNAAGDNDGTCWRDAYTTLQPAITEAGSGYSIWVALGKYYPTTEVGGSGDRFRAFQMKNNVAIYGGFNGTETLLSARDYVHNLTELSGDIGTEGNDGDNCYHVFNHPNGLSLNNSAVLDGFTISRGNASTYTEGNGGGMYNYSSSPTVTNCTFSNNKAFYSGGGMNNFVSAPVITNCTFIGNSTLVSNGGGISNRGTARIVNCSFIGNSAHENGGGIYNELQTPVEITNCVFSSNSANTGGGMYNYASSPPITNCTFSGNSASSNGGGICNTYHSGPPIKNTIFWGNNTQIFNDGVSPEITYCCIQNGDGVFTGAGNIYTDPLFVDANGADNTFGTGDDNLALQDGSPCIGVGISTGVPLTDISGQERGVYICLGAFENNNGDPMPVELISFIADQIDNGVELKWQTATEINNYGFEVERSVISHQLSVISNENNPQSEIHNPQWEVVGFVEGNGNSNSPKQYSFIDVNPPAGNLQYRLKQVDTDGSYEYYTIIAKLNFNITTDVAEKQAPNEFLLSQNYPNPFNPETVISYQLSGFSHATLKVYDILGNEVVTLVDEEQQPGYYKVKFSAESCGDRSCLSTGIYIYKLTAGSFTSTKKLMLIK